MKIIKDAKGREWCLDLNLTAIERIRAEAGVDLLNIESFENIDGVKLAKALAAACYEDLVKAGIKLPEFINGFEGDTLEAAGDALMEELLRFFPSRRRQILQKAMSAASNVLNRQTDLAEAMVNGPDFESQVEMTLRRKFGASPESSASIPVRFPGDNST